MNGPTVGTNNQQANRESDSLTSRLARFPWVPYLLVFVSAATIVLIQVSPWGLDSADTFLLGSDSVWQQAMVEVFAQGGPVGSTDHLAWPIGVSGWTLPQFGLLLGTLSWILAGWFGMPSIVAVFVLLALSAGMTAVGCLFLFRAVVGPRFLLLAMVLALAFATATMNVQNVLNLAMWYLIPVTLAFLFGWEAADKRRHRFLVVGLVVAAVLSPLWWVAMLALFLPVLLLAPLAHRRWMAFRGVLIATGIMWGALALQATLTLIHAGPGADYGRDNSQVPLLSGTLADLLAGTPLQRELLPNGDLIPVGINNIGTLASLLAFIGVLWLLTVPPVGRRPDLLLKVAGGLVSLLFFVVGGLGSLTVLAATVLGLVTPARGLRFFALVLALIVTLELLSAAQRRWGTSASPRRWPVTITVAVALVAAVPATADWESYADWKAYETAVPPETAATGFIHSSLAPCPVAQLPQDILPGSRVASLANNFTTRELYRGLNAYVLEPKFFWSYGSYAADQPATENPLNSLGVALDNDALDYLTESGYCAVLYDQKLADMARTEDLALEGRDLGAIRQPDHHDNRYDVFLLTE